MSATTSIEWCEKTWNPVRGCSVISPGCVNCYAMKQAHRFSGEKRTTVAGTGTGHQAYYGLTKLTSAGPQWTGKVVTVESALREPLSWRKPARIFVNSMSDLFHEDVDPLFVGRVFNVMGQAAQHTFQVLTKRPARMRELVTAYYRALNMEPLTNVWLGVSVENQHFADERIPLLLQTPAAVRFISAEPLLGPIDLQSVLIARRWAASGPAFPSTIKGETQTLDWVIVGGESGPGARPFDLAWARSIVQQCKAAGVACFVKQVGSNPFDSARQSCPPDECMIHGYSWLTLKAHKGGDPAEWPEDLRVREFPNTKSQLPTSKASA